MDSSPISCKTLGRFFGVDGKRLQEQYISHLSDFIGWDQVEHAQDWLLFPENLGEYLSIDETSLSLGELYTVLTNKAAKGKKGALVAIVKGTESETVIKVLCQISQELSSIWSHSKDRRIAFKKLAIWYNKIEKLGYKSFNTIARTIQNNYETILNYFDNKSTNTSAESFNAKIKAFRSQFRRVRNVNFFLFRLSKIYA